MSGSLGAKSVCCMTTARIELPVIDCWDQRAVPPEACLFKLVWVNVGNQVRNWVDLTLLVFSNSFFRSDFTSFNVCGLQLILALPFLFFFDSGTTPKSRDACEIWELYSELADLCWNYWLWIQKVVLQFAVFCELIGSYKLFHSATFWQSLLLCSGF